MQGIASAACEQFMHTTGNTLVTLVAPQQAVQELSAHMLDNTAQVSTTCQAYMRGSWLMAGLFRNGRRC